MALVDPDFSACERLLVVDLDPGIDDAFALLILFAAHKLGLICLAGIVCSVGNTNQKQSCDNVATIVELLALKEDSFEIAYFEGASSSMIKPPEYSDFFGKDGLGDVDNRPAGDRNHFGKYFEFQRFIYDLVQQNPEKVSFMALGPLTVLATLLLQQPDLDLKDVWIMGGNDIDRDDFAEWNFYFDPHAAHIALNHSKVPLYIGTYQACERAEIPMSWRRDILGAIDTLFINFMNQAEENFYGDDIPDLWLTWDPIIAAAYLRNEVILDTEDKSIDVYIGENREKGLVIEGEKNATFIKEIDVELFKMILADAALVFY